MSAKTFHDVFESRDSTRAERRYPPGRPSNTINSSAMNSNQLMIRSEVSLRARNYELAEQVSYLRTQNQDLKRTIRNFELHNLLSKRFGEVSFQEQNCCDRGTQTDLDSINEVPFKAITSSSTYSNCSSMLKCDNNNSITDSMTMVSSTDFEGSESSRHFNYQSSTMATKQLMESDLAGENLSLILSFNESCIESYDENTAISPEKVKACQLVATAENANRQLSPAQKRVEERLQERSSRARTDINYAEPSLKVKIRKGFKFLKLKKDS